MRHVAIAVPAYTGTVHMGTMRALMTDLLALAGRGDRFSLYDECGSAIIADTRAELAARFLASDATDLIFVDHDVVWEAGGLRKLLDHPVDVVGAAYPFRRDPIEFPVAWLDKPDLWAHPDTGLLEVAGVAGGFVRIRRTVLERMTERYADLTYQCDRVASGKAVGLFEPYRIGTTKLSEDYAFCRRWRDMGGQIWVDPSVTMAHIGNKTFTGNLGQWLKSRS